ncbi:MAG: ArsR family transcriptional regulator [Bacteroidetes bacterium]|nr:ArsR family transcriptional regulator [Bacteroidota bacterium]
MLNTLITSKTRIKLLLRFFLNSDSTSYLRNLESEFAESTNAIRVELNRFEKAGLLITSLKGNRKIFQANQNHPLYSDIHNILVKYVGLDQIIDKVVQLLGGVEKAYITGDLALGLDVNSISLLLIGDDINRQYLAKLIKKAEILINKKITCVILPAPEEKDYLKKYPEALLIWLSNHEISLKESIEK